MVDDPNEVDPQTTTPTAGRFRRWWRPVMAVVGILFAGFFFLVSRQVLAIVQKPSWPPAANAITAAGAQQAAEAFAARSDPRPADVGMPYAWSTAATLEPWPEGKTFFPKIFADVQRGSLVGAHPDVRLARRRDRHPAQRPSDREDEAGSRGARDRRRSGKPGVRAGRADVHPARRRRSADRRQRSPPLGQGRPLPRPPHLRLEPGRCRPGRPPQALRDRRHRGLDGRRRDRGPLCERQVPRRHGPRHRERRPPGAGAVPDELPRPRRTAAGRPLEVLPGPAPTPARSR